MAVTVTALFWLIKKTIGLRDTCEEELKSLDLPEHGTEAHPEDAPVKA